MPQAIDPANSDYWSINPDHKEPTDGDKLPSADSIEAPEVPDLTSSMGFSNQADFDAKLQTKIDELKSQQSTDRANRVAGINASFDPKIQEAEQYREDVTDATTGQMGTNRRLSTAALSYVDARRGDAQKIVNNLVSLKAEAVSNMDTALSEDLDKKIQTWRDNELQWATLQNQVAMNNFNMQMQKAGFKLNVAQYNDTKTANEEARIKQNFTDLANYGYDFSTMSDEDKQGFADAYGITPEAATGVFAGIKAAIKADKEGKEIEKMSAVYDLLGKVERGKEIDINGVKYKGLKSNKENQLNYEEIKGGIKYYHVLNTLTGKDEFPPINMGPAYAPTKGSTISLSEAIELGDPTLAGKGYGAIPKGTTVPTDSEKKEFAAYETDLKDTRARLAADQISWDQAFAEISGAYPSINWYDLEKELGADRYKGHTGAKAKSSVMPVTIVNPPK